MDMELTTTMNEYDTCDWRIWFSLFVAVPPIMELPMSSSMNQEQLADYFK